MISLVNGLQGDPAVYCFCPRTGDAVLFDLGTLDALPHRDLLKVRQAFVSHTHIDHFIGFDRLLRVNVPHFRHLEIAGPTGIIENVIGKLRGYCWNLLGPKQLQFTVHEISAEGSCKSVTISSDDQFKVHPFPAVKNGGYQAPLAFVTQLKDGTQISATALDHGTDSIAYAMRSPNGFQVDTEAMQRLGVSPGPWLKELQKAASDQNVAGQILIDGKNWEIAKLAQEILQPRKGEAIGYLTDAIFDQNNLQRMRQLLCNVDTLICESNFRDVDYPKAFAKKHLTTKQAALIAAWVGAQHLKIFHLSNIYPDQHEEMVAEANGFFEQFKVLEGLELEALIKQEWARATQ